MRGSLAPFWRARRPAAVMLVAVLMAGCGGSGHSHSTASTGSTPAPPVVGPHAGNDTLISIFGGGNAVTYAPAATLTTLHELGVDRIRVDVRWSTIAPDLNSRHAPAGFDGSDPADYPAASWTLLDQVVRDATARGIGIDATIDGTAPRWAEGPGDPLKPKEPKWVWKPQPALYADFVRAVATRYDGHYTPPGASHPLPRIAFWSLWNEPNYGQDLAPQATHHNTVEVAPGLYRGLVNAGYAALKATGHGHDTILYGEIAPAGQTVGNVPGNFAGMVPLRFLRALYCVNASFQVLRGTAATERGCPASGSAASFRAANPALFAATGFAAHPYPQLNGPPTAPTPDEPDYADFAALPKLEQTLDKAYAAYGDNRQVPIYSTEFGYHTDPPEAGEINPTLAATYLNEAEYLSWVSHRIHSYDQYLLLDPPPDQSAFDTGLESDAGVPKPTFDAYRLPLFLPRSTQSGGHGLEVWGEVRPLHFYRSSRSVAIQFARGSSAAYRTVRTVTPSDAAGYFDTTVTFPATGTVRLAWRYPGGATVHSRTAGITVH